MMMMEFKGTSGKWFAEKPIESIGYWYVNNENNPMGRIATCYGSFGDEDESFRTEANAKLIASAPDLLKALMMLIEETEDYENNSEGGEYLEVARLKAKKAIEKALK